MRHKETGIYYNGFSQGFGAAALLWAMDIGGQDHLWRCLILIALALFLIFRPVWRKHGDLLSD